MSDVQRFEVEALRAHNKYRDQHGAPPLQLNKDLCNMAARYAAKIAEKGVLQHSRPEDSKYRGQSTGENLYCMYSTGPIGSSGVNAMESWYEEIKDYDFNHHGFAMNTGHFTQVVWRGSTQLGIGRAEVHQGAFKKVYIVANYFPAGNMMGSFPNNVLPKQ